MWFEPWKSFHVDSRAPRWPCHCGLIFSSLTHLLLIQVCTTTHCKMLTYYCWDTCTNHRLAGRRWAREEVGWRVFLAMVKDGLNCGSIMVWEWLLNSTEDSTSSSSKASTFDPFLSMTYSSSLWNRLALLISAPLSSSAMSHRCCPQLKVLK